MAGRFEVTLEARFRAAHALRHYRGRTEPAHGHNFRVLVTVRGRKLDRAGILVDFAELKPVIQQETRRLAGGLLNETVQEFRDDGGGLSPSTENIARLLYRRLRKRVPRGVKLVCVEVFESPGCSAAYRE